MFSSQAASDRVILVGHVTKDGALAPARARALVDVCSRSRQRERSTARCARPRTASGSPTRRRVRMSHSGLVECSTASAALRQGRHGAPPAASCSRRWRARGRCWSRCRRSSARLTLVPPRRVCKTASTQPWPGAGGALSARSVPLGGSDVFATSSAVVPSTSRGRPRGRARGRQRRAQRHLRRGPGGGARLPAFGSSGLTGSCAGSRTPSAAREAGASASPPCWRAAVGATGRRDRCAPRWRPLGASARPAPPPELRKIPPQGVFEIAPKMLRACSDSI